MVHYPGTGWEVNAGIPQVGTPQPFPVDIEINRAFVGLREADDTNTVDIVLPSGGVLGPDAFAGLTVQAVTFAGSASSGFIAAGIPGHDGGRGKVVIFESDGGSGWTLFASPEGENKGDRFGSSLAAKPQVLVIGAESYGDNGAAYIFIRTIPGWAEFQRLDSPALDPQTDAEFGAVVDIDAEEGWIAVGSPKVDRVTAPGARTDVGGVYLYEDTGIGWAFETLLRPPGATHFDYFGSSVALHGSVLVAGSPGEDGATVDEGAAYVYQRSGSTWVTVPTQRLVDALAEEGDELGTSVAVGDLGALVGAPKADGSHEDDGGAVLAYRGVEALFLDGLESGSTAPWSLPFP